MVWRMRHTKVNCTCMTVSAWRESRIWHKFSTMKKRLSRVSVQKKKAKFEAGTLLESASDCKGHKLVLKQDHEIICTNWTHVDSTTPSGRLIYNLGTNVLQCPICVCWAIHSLQEVQSRNFLIPPYIWSQQFLVWVTFIFCSL